MEMLITEMSDLLAAMLVFLGLPAVIILSIFAACCAILFTFVYRVYIAYRMAVNRHREPIGWVLLSFCFSPILTWVILLIAGDEKK